VREWLVARLLNHFFPRLLLTWAFID
jgi:hypothetical protein